MSRFAAKANGWGRFLGKRPDWKKAWVRLAPDSKGIELFEANLIMAMKKYKPTSPGRRFMTSTIRIEGSSKNQPHKPLLAKHRSTGRPQQSWKRISIRHRGGGHKRRYRIIDFRRNKIDIPAKVERIEYDPNRIGEYRAVVLCRRRAPLHPRAQRPGRLAKP